MKERMMMVGGYLLAGIVSCVTLAAVAGKASDSEPLPVTVSAQDVAVGEITPKTEPAPKPKAKRGRRNVAKTVEEASAPEEAKPKARRSRRVGAKAAAAENDETPRKTRTRRRKVAAENPAMEK